MEVIDQLRALAALFPGKEPPVPKVRVYETGRSLESAWTLWRREESHAYAGYRTLALQYLSKTYLKVRDTVNWQLK
jgi:hypothetical protein